VRELESSLGRKLGAVNGHLERLHGDMLPVQGVPTAPAGFSQAKSIQLSFRTTGRPYCTACRWTTTETVTGNALGTQTETR
jgi:hypothetical protein